MGLSNLLLFRPHPFHLYLSQRKMCFADSPPGLAYGGDLDENVRYRRASTAGGSVDWGDYAVAAPGETGSTPFAPKKIVQVRPSHRTEPRHIRIRNVRDQRGEVCDVPGVSFVRRRPPGVERIGRDAALRAATSTGLIHPRRAGAVRTKP